MTASSTFGKPIFNFFEMVALKILKVFCPSPRRYVYGLKFFGFDDGRCHDALRIIFGFEYEDAKMTIGELIGNAYVHVHDENKSKTLGRLGYERAGQR